MANINVVGDFKKSGLKKRDITETVEAVFVILGSPLSSRAEVKGSLKNKPEGKGFLHSPLGGVGRNDSCTISKCGAGKVINIAFVEAEDIQKKNLEYRKINRPTDVLSFNYEDEGDILLCLDLILEMKETSEKLSEAVQKTIIHGVLHLFGYDHEKSKDRAIMENMEEKIFNKVAPTLRSGSSKDERK